MELNIYKTGEGQYLLLLAVVNALPVKVIIDSNFLFAPIHFNIDVYEGLSTLLDRKYEPVILSTNLEELEKMTDSNSTKLRRDAKLALKLAERCRILKVERSISESNDDVIVRVASKLRCPVATNDQALRKKLRNINVPVIYLRQKSRLEMDGAVY